MKHITPDTNVKPTNAAQRICHQEDLAGHSTAHAPGVLLSQRSWILVLATLLCLCFFSTATLADPSRKNCLNRVNYSQKKLLECITQDGLRIHAKELQKIASRNRNRGYRASGYPGYNASVWYVVRVLRNAGYRVVLQKVKFDDLVGFNVIAELPKGNSHNVIMLGAHLDSVFDGPGLNDNGSGSVALLELALMTRTLSPRNRVRYAWWAFEEVGLIGSAEYLINLTDRELNDIVLQIGPDMMGSPNAIRWIETFDPDDPGTDNHVLIKHRNALSQLFRKKFKEILGFEASTAAEQPFLLDYVGCGYTDYCNFLEFGIPAMDGIFTGTLFEEPSVSEAERFGVTANEPADPCYHQACDTIHNIDFRVLEENTDVTAAVLLELMFDRKIRAFNFTKDK